MNSTMISGTTRTSFSITSNPKLSKSNSFNQSPSQLNFNTSTRFSKSKSFNRISPIKASAAATEDPVYVNTQSFYELLGISESGTISEIKKAYKELARKYHPDVSPPDRTEEYTKRFIEVQEAYETLSDPETRALYDRNVGRGLGFHTFIHARRNRSSTSNHMSEDKDEWEERWQSQLEELIRNSNDDSSETMSWGARMRSKRC